MSSKTKTIKIKTPKTPPPFATWTNDALLDEYRKLYCSVTWYDEKVQRAAQIREEILKRMKLRECKD